MSEDRESDFNTNLLDLHLGQLSDAQEAELRDRLASDPKLAAENEVLAGVFAALRADRVPAPPRDLDERIIAAVGRARPALRTVSAPAARDQSAAEWVESGNTRIIRMRGMRDVLAVAAMIVLAVGLGVPSVLHMKERSRRTMCAANLAQLGQAMNAYASVFGNSLPFGGWSRGDSWRPTDEPGLTVRPNRQHVYLLLRNGYVNPNQFVCPSSHDVPMAADQVARRDDFLESANVSYAYQNMAGARPQVGAVDPELPILGDDNPLFDSGRPLFDLAVHKLGLRDLSQTNSRAHDGTGQNILTLGGSSKWITTPAFGAAGDNIWTLYEVTQYTGQEGPQAATDSHLLK
jgi:hypothetical protein